MRPRFVVMLCLAAVVGGLFEFVLALSPVGWLERVWIVSSGTETGERVVAGAYGISCWVCAWGLWHLRRWGRNFAMAYLAFVLVSFLLWGVRDGSEHELAYVMAWQMFVLPFVVFCFMYLYNGERYFD